MASFPLLTFQSAELVLWSWELSRVFYLVYGRLIHRCRRLLEYAVLTLQSRVCWLLLIAFSLESLVELGLHVCLPHHFRVVVKRKGADWILRLIRSLHLSTIVFQVESRQHLLHIGGSVAWLVAAHVWLLGSFWHAHSKVVRGRSLVVRTGRLHIQLV